IQWRRDAGLFGAASEFEQRTVDSVSAERTTSQTGAARLWWRPVRPIRTTAERQQTFSGPANHRTSLGLEWWPHPSLALELRGSDGSTGRAVRGGVALTVAGNQIYVREERNEGMGARTGSTLLGAQSALGPMGRTYSEYRWLHDANETGTQSVIGVEQGWRYASGLLLRLSGEHSARDRSAGGGSRVALSSDLSYRGRLPIAATTRGEYRVDGAGGRQRQVLTSSGLDWVGKAATRIRGDSRGVLGTGTTHSVLWAQRLEYSVRKPFRYGAEYRVLSQREVGDRSAGWLNEVSWDPAPNFRFGVGYNFTHFSGDPLQTGPESSHGWFLRAQSRY